MLSLILATKGDNHPNFSKSTLIGKSGFSLSVSVALTPSYFSRSRFNPVELGETDPGPRRTRRRVNLPLLRQQQVHKRGRPQEVRYCHHHVPNYHRRALRVCASWEQEEEKI